MSAFWTESYRRHFQKYLHKPLDIQVYHDSDSFSLKVAIHDRAVRNYRIYVSMGLADKLVENEETDFGEVVLYSDVSDLEVPQLFINALFFILHNDIPLGRPFAIGGIDLMRPAFAQRYGKSALYFSLLEDFTLPEGHTLSEEEDESFTEVHNGDQVGRVYQAFFISSTEERFLEKKGPEEFAKQWQQQKGDRNSLRRRSII